MANYNITPTFEIRNKKPISCELGLCIALLLCCVSAAFCAKANLGMSSFGLLALVLNLLVPQISFGLWNYLSQAVFVVVLCILMKRVKATYLFSFVLAFLYGFFIDFFSYFLGFLPSTLFLRGCYFAISYVMGVVGVAFLILCRLPIFPFDTFTREIPQKFGIPYKTLRTSIDIACLVLALVLDLTLLDGLPGIGVGTVILSLGFGYGGSFVMGLLRRRYEFCPRRKRLAALVED